MSLNVIAEDKICKGLVCPYTNRPVTVRMIAHGKSAPLFFSPDAYDPSVPVDSSVQLFKELSTRRGIIGAAQNESLMVCPYTGNTLTIRQAGDMHYAEGGFSPRTPCPDKVAFVRSMMMRDGKVPKDAPAAAPRVTLKRIEPVETRPAPVTEVSEDAAAYVEANADALMSGVKRAVKISVPEGAPKKRTPKAKPVSA